METKTAGRHLREGYEAHAFSEKFILLGDSSPDMSHVILARSHGYTHQTPAHMSYSQYFWQAKRTWILHNNASSGHNVIPVFNPMSILNMALLSTLLTLAHVAWEPSLYSGLLDALGRQPGKSGLTRYPWPPLMSHTKQKRYTQPQ